MSSQAATMEDALTLQAVGCASLGSSLYERLLTGLLADFVAGGITYRLLADRPRPVHDAVPLRYLGAIHRLALRGDAPGIARHYPSCGGKPGPTLVEDFLEAVARDEQYVVAALDTQVQTNEVGRAALLAGGFALLARRHGAALRTFEIGASAGLITRWNRYAYDTGATQCGDPASRLRFTDVWRTPADLSGAPTVVRRAACDLSPLQIADPEAQLRLLSFVWPDQATRFERLRRAIDIAVDDPLAIDTASADDWIAHHVAPQRGVTTVVVHSIVWQYLPATTKRRIRDHLDAAGASASPDAPLAWLRMEPAGPVADLRLTSWPGGHQEVLATAGYHGADIEWIG